MFRLFRKKYYKEVECRACQTRGTFAVKVTSQSEMLRRVAIGHFDPVHGVWLCPGCNGRGTQTVLERVE